jgi:hypothetical protein
LFIGKKGVGEEKRRAALEKGWKARHRLFQSRGGNHLKIVTGNKCAFVLFYTNEEF